ncbi:hypothetical protein SAMN06265222_106144 [Neorhodopirellula lusitana]|uniref:Sulfatase N-terminal domain-containing protein n=2 Tax=Neorhodopirellula lusitana TaxID=445327 RepID=A0ABY1Q8D0_9BACT|nr:hypothetical protein SAMN06265222_106144 [Neorhodopirellula lusitana]
MAGLQCSGLANRLSVENLGCENGMCASSSTQIAWKLSKTAFNRSFLMLLLTFEGFSPAALSCYGSSWNRTETMDALAASGTTWDRVITSTTDPLAQLDRWLSAPNPAFEGLSLVTDDERLAERSSMDRVSELIHVPNREAMVADSIEETTLAALAAVASEQLVAGRDVWLHSRFLTRCWDAPRYLFPIDFFDDLDDGPLDPSETIEEEMRSHGQPVAPQSEHVAAILEGWQPPNCTIANEDDPDWIMAWMRTYGCQIRLIDAVVQLLCDVSADRINDPVVIAGTSGFALGQNNAIGHRSGAIRSCHLHVPFLVGHRQQEDPTASSPDWAMGVRNRNVMTADQIGNILTQSDDNFVQPDAWAATQEDQSVITDHAGTRIAATTDRWFYVANPSDELTVDGSLYLKPDDACDINDVARLRPETADTMQAWLTD